MAMFLARLLLAFMFCFEAFAAQLPADEVETLKQIAKTLGKNDWNFDVDPCSGESGWFNDEANTPMDELNNSVTCTDNCTSANNAVCHVTRIVLKRENLGGTIPPEIVRLPFLQEFDVAGNYLNGTIPPEWGSMKLESISLFGNRVTGPIPKELGNISTLTSLDLRLNQLSGTIPRELGNLPSIKRLLLTSNNLTGELPESLSNLTTLQQFYIGDNNFVGNIPNFIQKWTNISILVIQGSGLSGPIPSSIASLTKLTDLRISDLLGNNSDFPPLNDAKSLQILILRSCNITGQLPPYIGNLKSLEVLDLSFNKLIGDIPDSFHRLSRNKHIYLTGNSLTGPVPSWVQDGSGMSKIDLSYNNFTSANIESYCRRSNLNIFASSKGNTPGVDPCLKSSCGPKSSSFHINCGGSVIDNTYEGDSTEFGPTNLFRGGRNWALSSTGHSVDNDSSPYIETSKQISELYSDA